MLLLDQQEEDSLACHQLVNTRSSSPHSIQVGSHSGSAGSSLSLSPADKVMVQGKEVPYVPLSGSFSDYSSDSWTYDGRLASTTVSTFSLTAVSLSTDLCLC